MPQYAFSVLEKANPTAQPKKRVYKATMDRTMTIEEGVRNFLSSIKAKHAETPMEQRPHVELFYDELARLDQCVRVLVEDASKLKSEIPLDRTPGQLGLPEGTIFELTRSKLIMGGSQHAPVRLRLTRIRSEVLAFMDLCRANPGYLELVSPRPEDIADIWELATPLSFRLTGTRGWALSSEGEPYIRDEHLFRVTFPVGYLVSDSFRVLSDQSVDPLFHPNVSEELDADGGGYYVCLYPDDIDMESRGLVSAIVRLEELVTWRSGNTEEIHRFGTRALSYWEDASKTEMRDLEPIRLRSLFI